MQCRILQPEAQDLLSCDYSRLISQKSKNGYIRLKPKTNQQTKNKTTHKNRGNGTVFHGLTFNTMKGLVSDKQSHPTAPLGEETGKNKADSVFRSTAVTLSFLTLG